MLLRLLFSAGVFAEFAVPIFTEGIADVIGSNEAEGSGQTHVLGDKAAEIRLKAANLHYLDLIW